MPSAGRRRAEPHCLGTRLPAHVESGDSANQSHTSPSARQHSLHLTLLSNFPQGFFFWLSDYSQNPLEAQCKDTERFPHHQGQESLWHQSVFQGWGFFWCGFGFFYFGVLFFFLFFCFLNRILYPTSVQQLDSTHRNTGTQERTTARGLFPCTEVIQFFSTTLSLWIKRRTCLNRLPIRHKNFTSELKQPRWPTGNNRSFHRGHAQLRINIDNIPFLNLDLRGVLQQALDLRK